MGRTAAVTFEMVASAAEAMQAEKINVVTRAVRERLGNVGSMGTINNHLQAWKARQEQHVTSALTLPPALQKSILDFIGVELSNARSTLETDIAAQQKEMADLANDNEKQFSELEINAETIDTLRNEIAKLQGKSSQLEIDLTALKQDIVKERDNAEHARTELAKALLRLEAMPRLESDLNAVRSALETEHAGKISAEQAAAVAIARMESGNQRIEELHDRLAKAEANNAKLQEKIDAAVQEASEARSALETEHAGKISAEQAAAVAIAKMESGNQRIEELTEHLAKSGKIIDVATQDVVLLSEKIKAEQLLLENAKNEIEDLKTNVEPIKIKGKPGPKPKSQAKSNDTIEADLKTMPPLLQG